MTATVLLTLGWGIWHLPMLLVLSSYRGFTAATTVVWWFGLLCGALVFTWLHDRSGGSVALVAVWHGTYNLATATRAAEGLLQAATTTVVLAAAVALVVLELRARRHDRSVLSGTKLPNR